MKVILKRNQGHHVGVKDEYSAFKVNTSTGGSYLTIRATDTTVENRTASIHLSRREAIKLIARLSHELAAPQLKHDGGLKPIQSKGVI